MNVLILHQHFNTPDKGGAIRSYYLAKALIEKGISVSVVTGYNGKQYKKENVDGIEVHYLSVQYENRFGFLSRSFSFLRFVWKVILRADDFKQTDICYAISTPLTVGLAARWIKWCYHIPFIFEVGDLWPDAPVQMGIIRNPFLKWALYRLEKKTYAEAESIVALSIPIQQVVLQKIKKTIHLIPNMADTDFYKPESKKIELERKYDVEGKFVVSYIGAVGIANGLDYFLECARESRKEKLQIHFLLCGDGAMVDKLKESADQSGLGNLSFIPFQNREGVREIMNVTDASFICYKPVPILETGSPNKYFDGLAAGKLILVNFGGWIKEEIEKMQCGISINAKSPEDFVDKIRPFTQQPQKLETFQQAARKLAEEKYSRKLLSESFRKIF